MSNLTEKQLEAQKRLASKYSDLEMVGDEINSSYHVVRFTNGEDHILNKVRYCVRIGKGGRLTIVDADRVLADRKACRVLALLLAYELNLSKRHVKLWR